MMKMPMIEQQALTSEACVTGRPHLTLAPPAQSPHCRIGCLPCPRRCPANVVATVQRVAACHARAARHPAGPPTMCDAGGCRCELAPARPEMGNTSSGVKHDRETSETAFRPLHTAPNRRSCRHAGVRSAIVKGTGSSQFDKRLHWWQAPA